MMGAIQMLSNLSSKYGQKGGKALSHPSCFLVLKGVAWRQSAMKYPDAEGKKTEENEKKY